MSKKQELRRWEKMVCEATPAEKKWLEEFAITRGIRGRYKAKKSDGRISSLSILMKYPCRIGVMMVSMEYVKKEVRRYRAEERRDRKREAERIVGAYI